MSAVSSPPRFVAHGARRVRRNRLALAAPWLLDVAVVVAAIVSRTPLVLVGLVHGTILGLVLSAYAYQRNPWPRLDDGEIAADAQGVWFDGALLFPRASIRQGFVYEQEGVWRVRLLRGRLSDEIVVPDEATGRGLLRALGLDASQTVAQFRVMSPFFGWRARKKMAAVAVPIAVCSFASAVLGSIFGRGVIPGVIVASELLLLFGLLFLFFPAKLFVGRDGLLHRWHGRETFTPVGKIAAVARCASSSLRNSHVGAEVFTEDGASQRFYVGQSKWTDAQASMLVDRIDHVLEGQRRGESMPFEASALRRGDRDVSAWIESLRALGSGARDDLRSIPADVERLVRLVEDPSAPALDRAAAAVALPTSLPPPDRERLRIAAAATAEPHLRITLEKVAEGEVEDASVAESLAELDAVAGASQLGARALR